MILPAEAPPDPLPQRPAKEQRCARRCGRDSGLQRGRRSVADGRSAVRRVLYMAPVSAGRGSSRVAHFYRRLVARGKPPKLALIATMRKMLVTLNAIARAQQPWSETTLQPAA